MRLAGRRCGRLPARIGDDGDGQGVARSAMRGDASALKRSGCLSGRAQRGANFPGLTEFVDDTYLDGESVTSGILSNS
jgi:hypothetical protein